MPAGPRLRRRYTYLRLVGPGWDRRLWLPAPGLTRAALWQEMNRAAEETVRNLPAGEHLEHLATATLLVEARLKAVRVPPASPATAAGDLVLGLGDAIVACRNGLAAREGGPS